MGQLASVAIADYCFRVVPWENSLGVIKALGFDDINLCLMEGLSHIDPMDFTTDEAVDEVAARVGKTVAAHELGINSMHITPRSVDTVAVNSRDAEGLAHARSLFGRGLRMAEALGIPRITVLPGLRFEDESYETSFERAIGELTAWAGRAHDAGVSLSVEAHGGSLMENPAEAARLASEVPHLALTCDPAYFISSGSPMEDLDVLYPYVGYVHGRGGRPGRLQAPMRENTIDWERLIAGVAANDLATAAGLESVCMDVEGESAEHMPEDHCHLNELDVATESVLLKERFEAAIRGEAWEYPADLPNARRK
ncbi:TIM barrel protein [Nocardioides sp. GY 10127]|uniref:sugar phosphate isomerase/epimerase family protein n=1 Tax=Nocardioides sp. GY 10127 TaxID=2569762 RepID=UPI0010A79C51|nr:TIM barrel protein [Nocardioides sp. GY 10127]TIC86453.1 sugar phosphate isomerase/epimerase [Nocardioides sp. GY 10127]